MAIRLVFSREPYWLVLADGVELFVDPPTTMRVFAARHEAERLFKDLVEAHEVVTAVGGSVVGGPDVSDDDHKDSAIEAMFVVCLGEMVIHDWKGVQSAEGTPLAFEPSLVSALFEDETICARFRLRYLKPIFEVIAEKKD